jgi:hypothetical protein
MAGLPGVHPRVELFVRRIMPGNRRHNRSLPGYVNRHVIALERGGSDTRHNME